MLLAPWALPAVLLVGCIVALRVAGSGKYRTLSLRAAHSLLEGGNLVVLDVRERAELVGGVLPGALSIPLSQLRERMEQVPSGTLLVYCASGMRSRFACSWLSKAGRQEVFNLAGGIEAWRQHGLPITARPN
ncbi:rhodanese-like domain-containing protein [bacterium]|nr:rhodanese-like domain-containing protein [bacterium]